MRVIKHEGRKAVADYKREIANLKNQLAELRQATQDAMPVIDWVLKNEDAMAALSAGTAAVVPFVLSDNDLERVGAMTNYNGEYWSDTADADHRDWWESVVAVTRIDKSMEAE